MILRRDTHLDQLANKLREERVRRVAEPLLSGAEATDSIAPDDLQYVRDLGLITASGPVAIANPIYREVIPRDLTWTTQEMSIHHDPTWYVGDDGALRVDELLAAFQEFFREHSEHWVERFQYKEAGPQLLLQAFLQRVVKRRPCRAAAASSASTVWAGCGRTSCCCGRCMGRGQRRRPKRAVHRYRWLTDLPIRDGDDALRVNWLEIVSAKPDGTVTYRGAFVTSLDVNRDNVAELADCARARWKIENETFNVLKQHGYHLEHNFGHGKDTLAAVLVVPDLLAFALHTACELAETLWLRARRRLGTRYRLFEHLRTLAEYQVFPDWNALVGLLATGGTANRPP